MRHSSKLASTAEATVEVLDPQREETTPYVLAIGFISLVYVLVGVIAALQETGDVLSEIRKAQ